MVKNSALLLGLTLVWVGMAEQVSAQVELNQGDRVVFLGDSITQAGARPGGYVSLFRQAVDDQFGEGEIEVIGAGISGHKVPDCQKRLDRDVISKKANPCCDLYRNQRCVAFNQ